MHVGSRLIVDPVEAGLHGQRGKQAVLGPVSVAGGEINSPALVMEAVARMVRLLVPSLCHPNLHPWPLVHHRDGQRVELLLAALGEKLGQTLVTRADSRPSGNMS